MIAFAVCLLVAGAAIFAGMWWRERSAVLALRGDVEALDLLIRNERRQHDGLARDKDRIHAEIVADLADLAGVPAHGTLRDRIRELVQKERRLARVYTVLEAPPEVTVQVVKVDDAGKELPVPDKPGSVKP